MHRKQNIDLIPADTELEKTLRSLRKIKKAENSTMADERQEQNDEHREQLKRYSNRDFIGPLFSEIVLNGLKYATDAKRLEISAAEMKCH